MYKYLLVGGNEEDGVRLFSVELTDRARSDRHILKNQEIPFEHKKTCLYCEGGQTMEEVVESSSSEILSIQLDVVLGNLLYVMLFEQRGWTT